MPDFFSFINSVLWGSVMIYLLFGAGCWFTFRTGFVQFRYIRQFGKSLKNSIHPTARRFNLISVIVYQSCGARG